MDEVTTVKVSKHTKAKLSELGRKGETYEEIIQKLIHFYKNNARQGRNRR